MFQVLEEIKPHVPLKRSWVRIFEEAVERNEEEEEGPNTDLQHLKSGWQVTTPVHPFTFLLTQ